MLTSYKPLLVPHEMFFPLNQQCFFLQGSHVAFIDFWFCMKKLLITRRLIMRSHGEPSSIISYNSVGLY